MVCADGSAPADCSSSNKQTYESTYPFVEGEGLAATTFATETTTTRATIIQENDTTNKEILVVVVPMNDIPSSGYIDISLRGHWTCGSMTATVYCLSTEYC